MEKKNIVTLKTGVRSYVNDKGEAKNECLECSTWFKPKRKNSAKFCSDSCRVTFHLKGKDDKTEISSVEEASEIMKDYLNEEDMGKDRKQIIVLSQGGKLTIKKD